MSSPEAQKTRFVKITAKRGRKETTENTRKERVSGIIFEALFRGDKQNEKVFIIQRKADFCDLKKKPKETKKRKMF